MGVQGPEPARRAREEGERREDRDRDAEVERAQPRADQPHVVVERQPAHAHVVGADRDRLADRADVRQEVGVGEEHALGIAGAPRRVLDQRGVGGAGARRESRGPRGGELVH